MGRIAPAVSPVKHPHPEPRLGWVWIKEKTGAGFGQRRFLMFAVAFATS
jgi:hypothetical protein